MPAEKHRKTLAVGPSNPTPNRRSTNNRRGRGFETTGKTPADKHHKTLAAAPSISYHDEAFALARRGRRFQTTEKTPTEKHRKTLAVGPSISYHDEAFALARSGRRFQTKTDANGKASQDIRSRAVNRIHCQIDGAFAPAEGRETLAVGPSEVIQIRRDAECTSQLINLEMTHACVITDLATNKYRHYPSHSQR
jgi:hypothetical protein